MATKKDLVEAYSFSRRRLVTAFLSGAPGGREVEPARPGRTVVGGLALAVLLIAGAAIASVLAARTEEDWNKVGLVVSKQQPAPYVILDEEKHPTLIPVINYTSAQLIFGASVVPTFVDQSVIDQQTPGRPIGIANAPQVLPRASQFINQGWTSCTGDGLGMSLDISRTVHSRPEPNKAVTVKTPNGSVYMIARSSSTDPNRRAYAYPVPSSGGADDMLDSIHVDNQADAISVLQAWVRLFPAGGPLGADGFRIDGWGTRMKVAGAPAGAKVGQYYVQGNRGYVLTSKGLSPLDSFALKIYEGSVFGPHHRSPTRRTDAVPKQLPGDQRTYDDAHWPDGLPSALHGQVCGELSVHHGEEPKVELRGAPTSTSAVSEASTPATNVAFAIDRGQGAYVRFGDFDQTTSSSAWVIDASGLAYPLIGADTLHKLGYDQIAEPLIPDSWLKLFNQGVPLSASAALCPPYQGQAQGQAPNQKCHLDPSTGQ